jgi:GNAT superfamily N-acetyltransferase
VTAEVAITQLSSDDLTILHKFSCGDEDLDDFLKNDAWRLQTEKVATTYIAVDAQGALAGYFSLLADSVQLQTRERKKLGLTSDDHPFVPALKIARLAVNEQHQGSGVGLLMTKACYYMAQTVAKTAGCRLLTVDAYPAALDFYLRLGFKPNRAGQYKDREHPSLRLDVFESKTPDWL